MAFYIDESSNIQWGLDQSTGGVTFRTQLKNDEITSVRGEELQINDILEFGGGNACSDACMADSDGYAIGLKLNGITFDENRQQWDVNGGFVYLDNSAVVPFEKLDSTATSCTTGASFAGTDLIPKVDGCTNPVASNYDPDATYDDGSCILTPLSVVADSILEELGCPPRS